MSEIDIFVSPNGYHHFGPQEEVEEQHVRWKHWTLGQRDRLSSEGFEGTEVDNIKPQKIVIVSPVGHGASRFTDVAFQGFFSHFSPISKEVRGSAASAEMTRQVEISTLSAHQMAHGGVVAYYSSWTVAAYE